MNGSSHTIRRSTSVRRRSAGILLALALGTPLAGAQQPLFSFVQISDSQPQTTTHHQNFVDVLRVISEGGQPGKLLPRPIDFVVFAGDITYGNTIADWNAATDKLDTWLTANGIPYRAVPGNHDVDNSDTSRFESYIGSSDPWDMGSAAFAGHNGVSRTTCWRGLRFVGFNNSNPGWNTIPAADVTDISSRVSAGATAGENVFLLCHHPHDERDRLPLVNVLPNTSIVGYLRGHIETAHISRGLTGIDNPSVWDVDTNYLYTDRVLVYYEVFTNELRARVVFIDDPLPSPTIIPLVHPMTMLTEAGVGFAGPVHANARTDPTRESPERKLWHRSGTWWGILWSDTAGAYRIQRLNSSNQTWTDTGTSVSTTAGRSFDVLASGDTLWVLSNVSTVPGTSGNGSPGQLQRFTYSSGQTRYNLDSGFPVAVNDARSETLALARDSLGTLWATWTNGGQVLVNHTVGGNDAAWATPLVIPGATGLAAEETSAIVNLGGRIGVLWPRSAANRVFFALHTDGDPDGVWTTETATSNGSLVGDQIDLVSHQGRALAAVRASGGTVNLLERSSAVPGSGVWTVHEIAAASAGLHDPCLVVDGAFDRLRFFATGPTPQGQSLQGGGAIYGKLSALSPVGFPHGRGTLLVQDGARPSMGFATSTRQVVDGASDLVVLATNAESERYWHAFDGLSSLPGLPVANFTASPTGGLPPLLVQFNDLSTGAPTDWLWDFGDGQSSTEPEPQHVYSGPGTFSVSLRVASGAGEDTFTRNGYVVIGAPPPSVTYTPVADAKVSQGSANSNLGLDTTLRVKNESGSSFQSFLRFDLSSLAGTIQTARLRLFCTDSSNQGGSAYLVANNSWTETGITWNNKPALPASALNAAGSVSAGSWAEIEVTGAFSSAGIYTLALAGGSSNSALYSSREGTNPPQLVLTLVGGAAPPVADFVGAPLSGPAPLTVSFTDNSTNAPTGWTWDFGDGATSTSRNPAHTYQQPGTYTVLLDVSNGAGMDSLTRLDYVSVSPPSSNPTFMPAADAKVYEGSPNSNQGLDTTLRVKTQTGASYQSFLKFDLASLTGSVTSARLRLFCTDASNSGGRLYPVATGWTETGITWNNRPTLPGASLATLGAVAANTWVEIDVTSSVPGAGLYAFALAGGSTDSVYYSSREGSNPPQLVVQSGTGGPPVADFSASPLSGNAPLSVTFTDLSTGATSWLWTFGDGATSTAQDPVHVYANPGLFTVSLQATNSSGSNVRTRTNLISVQSPGGQQTLLPVADSRVNESSPNTNYGTDVAMRVRSEAGGSYHSYVRFDLSSLTGTVTSARLRLFSTDGSDVGGIVFSTSSSWSETGITWSNKPAPAGGALASAGTVATNTWVELDVTSAVSAGGLESFVLQSTSSNSCLYSSREGANPPQLVITSGAL